MTSILIIRPGGIGDAVLSAPMIRSLKENNPYLHITILAESRNAGVFNLIAGVDRLFCYDSPKEFIKALRGSYDVVIDTEQWHRLSAVVARFISAPVKIGFGTNERRRMFTHTVSYSHDDYESLSFVRLLAPLGIEPLSVELAAPFLSVPTVAVVKAAGLTESICDVPIVAIFPGASINERRWGADNFRRMAEVLSVSGIKVAVIGGSEDREQCDKITGGGLGLNLAGMTSLQESAAVIQKSALLICGDSGVLHIAVGLGIPTISLFGPGRAKKWSTQDVNHIVINKGLPCSPCTTFGTTPPCPNGVGCMAGITPDEVAAAAMFQLGGTNPILQTSETRPPLLQ